MRYYYTDKLAAKWMEKNFGMKFLDVWDGELNVVPLNQREVEKFYIHPDSLNLLETQPFDIVTDDDGIDCYARLLEKNEDGTWRTAGYSNRFLFKPQYHAIIARNGIQFMWPEVEND